jgi:hypothetical protein
VAVQGTLSAPPFGAVLPTPRGVTMPANQASGKRPASRYQASGIDEPRQPRAQQHAQNMTAAHLGCVYRSRHFPRGTLMSCLVLDRPNVLSYNSNVDLIKPRNPSHAFGSADDVTGARPSSWPANKYLTGPGA